MDEMGVTRLMNYSAHLRLTKQEVSMSRVMGWQGWQWWRGDGGDGVDMGDGDGGDRSDRGNRAA